MVSNFREQNLLNFPTIIVFLALISYSDSNISNYQKWIPLTTIIEGAQFFLREYEIFSDVVFYLPAQQFTLFTFTHIQMKLRQNAPFISVKTCRDFQNDRFTQDRGRILLATSCDCDKNVKFKYGFDIGNSTTSAIVLFFAKSTELLMPCQARYFGNHFLAAITPNNDTFDIFEYYRPTAAAPMLPNYKYSTTIRKHNYITKINHLDESEMLSERSQSNFNGNPFRIAAVEDTTYAYDTNITRRKNGSKYEYNCHASFGVEILRALEYTMNFTTKLRVTSAWGHVAPNKSWVGMIHLLLEKQADLAISSTADLPFRRAVVDFNMATSQLSLAAFFRTPRSGSQSNALLAPFRWDFWAATFVWLFAASLSLIFFRTTLINYGVHPGESGSLWGNADCFQWALCTVCLQGFYSIPTVPCFRWVIGVGYVGGMLLYAVYSGTLISFLSVTIEPIKTMDQLLGSDFEFSVEDSPIPLKFLAESPNPQVKKLFARRRPEPAYGNTQMAAKELTKGSFAFIVNDMDGYGSLNKDFLQSDACQMRDIVIKNGEQKQSSMVSKGATFKRTVDLQILRMHEYGLIKKWKNKYLQKKPKCDSHNQGFEGVDLQSVSLCLGGLFLGAILSIIIIILEMITTKYYKTHAVN